MYRLGGFIFTQVQMFQEIESQNRLHTKEGKPLAELIRNQVLDAARKCTKILHAILCSCTATTTIDMLPFSLQQ
jgi:hypothetical protein